MRKALRLAFVLALAVAPALAGEFSATGWIVDEWCNKNNANAEGAACAKACHEKGAALVLVAGDKVYKLDDQKLAEANLGSEVKVRGTLEGDKVKVAGIEKAGKKA